ncbi:MAG: hypothetical protein AAGB19_12700 [Cyanobacteria bacterium P01_F01_bin.3]
MFNILHDASVWWWAFTTNHSDWKKSRLYFTGGLCLERSWYSTQRVWRLRKPKLHVYNTYDLETAYLAAHLPTA